MKDQKKILGKRMVVRKAKKQHNAQANINRGKRDDIRTE